MRLLLKDFESELETELESKFSEESRRMLGDSQRAQF